MINTNTETTMNHLIGTWKCVLKQIRGAVRFDAEMRLRFCSQTMDAANGMIFVAIPKNRHQKATCNIPKMSDANANPNFRYPDVTGLCFCHLAGNSGMHLKISEMLLQVVGNGPTAGFCYTAFCNNNKTEIKL